MSTVLVYEEEDFEQNGNPIFEVLKEQAERIEVLEKQNNSLIEQEEVLLHLLELSAKTGSLMAKNIKILEELKKNMGEETASLPAKQKEDD